MAITNSHDSVRVVVSVPLKEELCELVEELEPRAEMVRDQTLLKPMRWPADWSGDPEWHRSDEEQKRFERLIDSAEVLFGIPDVDPAQLGRTVAANQQLSWVMATAAGGGGQVKAAALSGEELERVTFTTSAGVHASTLAEYAVFGLLAGAKNLVRLRDDQANKTWPPRWGMRHLGEMTVLVVGLGSIGRETARLLSSFGATVWGTSRRADKIDHVHRVVHPDELATVVPDVDGIVVALPGTAQTHHLISDEVLGATKPGTLIANVGRGTAVDEDALAIQLDSGRVAFAALDVFESEPLPADSPLWGSPNVLVSPHNAALTSREEERIARMFAENLKRFLDGEPMLSVVNTTEFY